MKPALPDSANRPGDEKDRSALLIYESDFLGHRANYFNVLTEYASKHPEVGSVVFAMCEDLFGRLEPSTKEALAGAAESRIRSRFLSPADLTAIAGPRGPKRSLARWKLATSIAEEVGASRIHFPVLDEVIAASALRPQTPYAISGIYFRPTVHYTESWAGFKGKLRQTGKKWLVQRYLARKDTIALLSLDPYFTDYARKHFRNGAKVGTVPEPLDPPTYSAETLAAGPAPRQTDSPVRFLFFGAMNLHKGVRELLDALALVDPESLKSAEFAFCGEGHLSGLIRERLPELEKRGVHLRFDDRYLPQRELDDALLESDVILAPYRNHFGSSGLMYLAAMLKKPVIAPNVWLMGRQTTEHHLGEAVDTGNPAEIAKAIERSVARIKRGDFGNPADYERFVEGHSREAFARTVFARALGHP